MGPECMTLLIKDDPDSGVVFEQAEGIATITLTRKRMSLKMLEALAGVPEFVAKSNARVLTLQSAGDDFCHGIDLSDSEILGSVQADQGRSVAALGGQVVKRWCELSIPTIAVISNWTIGAGACLVFACDFRFATPLARVSFPEIDRGMHLSWGILPRLVQECGVSMTRRLAMLGDPVSVEEFPVDTFTVTQNLTDDAHEFAARLAEKPPEALQHIKSVLASSSPTNDQIDEDVRRFVDSVSSPGFAQAMADWFSGKR